MICSTQLLIIPFVLLFFSFFIIVLYSDLCKDLLICYPIFHFLQVDEYLFVFQVLNSISFCFNPDFCCFLYTRSLTGFHGVGFISTCIQSVIFLFIVTKVQNCKNAQLCLKEQQTGDSQASNLQHTKGRLRVLGQTHEICQGTAPGQAFLQLVGILAVMEQLGCILEEGIQIFEVQTIQKRNFHLMSCYFLLFWVTFSDNLWLDFYDFCMRKIDSVTESQYFQTLYFIFIIIINGQYVNKRFHLRMPKNFFPSCNRKFDAPKFQSITESFGGFIGYYEATMAQQLKFRDFIYIFLSAYGFTAFVYYFFFQFSSFLAFFKLFTPTFSSYPTSINLKLSSVVGGFSIFPFFVTHTLLLFSCFVIPIPIVSPYQSFHSNFKIFLPSTDTTPSVLRRIPYYQIFNSSSNTQFSSFFSLKQLGLTSFRSSSWTNPIITIDDKLITQIQKQQSLSWRLSKNTRFLWDLNEISFTFPQYVYFVLTY